MCSLKSISHIVSNLVSFGDSKRVNDERLDINEIIQEIVSLLKYNAGYKHISIQFESGKGDLYFSGNRNEFKQVILNLVKNSFEAMPNGGKITIRTMKVVLPGRSLIRVKFQDNGPGIDKSHTDNIFMPKCLSRLSKTEDINLMII